MAKKETPVTPDVDEAIESVEPIEPVVEDLADEKESVDEVEVDDAPSDVDLPEVAEDGQEEEKEEEQATPVEAPIEPVTAPEPVPAPVEVQPVKEEVKPTIPKIPNEPGQISGRRKVRIAFGDDERFWTDADVTRYLESGQLPRRAEDGTWIDSKQHKEMAAKGWTDAQLKLYLTGKLKPTKGAPSEALLDEIIVRFGIPAAWSEEQIRIFLHNGTEPAKTVNGNWVNDQVRAHKPAACWSLTELKDWALDELKATAKATDNQLLAEVKTRFGVNNLDMKMAKDLLANLTIQKPSISETMIDQNLSSYADRMKVGKPITEAEAAGCQQLFFHTLTRILRMDGREFVASWTKVLDFVNEHRAGLFAPERAYRGLAQMSLTKRECKTFEQLMNLVIRTADPATRFAQAGKVNFEVVMRDIADEAIRQKLLGYYKIGA